MLDAAADQAISSDERDKRKQAAADKYAQIKDSQTAIVQFERQAQATLGAQTQRMRSDIIKEIAAAVGTKAKAAGYTMVVDTASDNANQTSVVIYTDGQNDLTAAVLAQLNAGAPIDLNKAAASVVPASDDYHQQPVAGHSQLALSRCTGFSNNIRCASSRISGIRPANGLCRIAVCKSSSRIFAAFWPGNQCSAWPSRL